MFSWAIDHNFWVSTVIYSNPKTRYMFEIYDHELVVFVFSGCLHELLPTVFGFHADLHGSHDSLYDWEISLETRRFRIFWPFS